MTVPITSDLAGYALFWQRWLSIIVAGAVFAWGVIVGLLLAITWKVYH